jgi:hypothetical protein
VIETGDTVRWMNGVPPRPPGRIRFPSNERQAVSENGLFVSPLLKHNESFSFTFAQPGTYTYIGAGEPNPRGTVQVNPAGVALTATAPIVVFGGETHVTGVVSNRREGESVRLLERPYGDSSSRA